jgi:hypothetical protein
MKELLVAIVTWLSANLELPASYDLPTIRYATPTEIAKIRYGAFKTSDKAREETSQSVSPTELEASVIAVYDSINHAIVLPIGWTAASPGDQSVLVHEMVHHLQYMAQLRFACPQEREAAAYKAQEKWLRLFDKSLEGEFSLDGSTLLVNTRCAN